MIALGQLGDWPDRLSRIVRGAAVAAALTAGAATLAGIVFWDADFYAVRDRWEHFKIAMFGEWTSTRRASSEIGSLEAIFDDWANVGVFRTVPVEGSTLKVMTGSTYESSSDLLADRASQRWCYVNLGTGSVTARVDLGRQIGDAPPIYPTIGAIAPAVLAAAGVDLARLADLARSHCRFGASTPNTTE